FTTGNKGSVTGTLPGVGGGAALGSDCSAPAMSPVAPTKDIPCNECSSSFSSLQKYMEHHCPNARLPTTGGSEEGEEVGMESEDERTGAGAEMNSEMEEESDVENLCGEIIYQPDGSAFILEDTKEQCGSQGELPSALQFRGLLSPQTFPNAQVSSGQSDYLTADGAAKNSCVSKDVPNNVDLSKFEGCISDGRRKPVLMCFLCKLSFGYSRSFVTHAVHDHRMTLNEQEQKQLSNKHISAIIQGIGKDKEPLISFLEPKKPPNSVLPHFPTPANFLGPDAGLRSLWNAFHSGESADSLQAGFAFLKDGQEPPGLCCGSCQRTREQQ
uniref:ZFHX4 n=1 Tax=Neogobius melanostomus TaxID=47308 RepID=A0A8C6T4F5_9GOBI